MKADYFLISFYYTTGNAIHIRLVKAPTYEEACKHLMDTFGEKNVHSFENLTIILEEYKALE